MHRRLRKTLSRAGRRPAAGRTTAGLIALALAGLALAGAPAHAASSSKSTPASTSTDPRYAALAKAASTGSPVTIDSLTTGDSSTQALPDGTLATTTTLEPTRMQNSAGAWEDIDPTLIVNPDGTISTTATPNTLTLSGGGTGSVITTTDQSGHSLALSLPVTLPTPTLDGASATYPNVYPGVNLTVTAAPSGGFSEVFEVTDPSAQAQAQAIKFTTALSGLSMSQASDGSMTVTDSSTGQAVISAPPAVMWDSSTTGTPATGVSDEFETVTDATSSTAGPGTSAHTGTLPITDASGTLALDGSSSNLDTTTPTYPLYLDPTWTEPYQSGGTQAYDEFEEGSGCEGYNNFDNVSQPGVGVVSTNTACPGPYESYFQIDTSNVINPSYKIQSATLKISEEYSSLDSCGEGSTTISIYTTSPISNATQSNYWTSRPAHGQEIDTEKLESDGNADGTTCAGGVVAGNFNVETGIAQVRANNWPNWTFAMVETGSDGNNSLERFNNNPSIYTVYDIPPNTPDNLNTWPTPVTGVTPTGELGTNQCPPSSSPGYLGIGNIGGSDIAELSARLTSPIAAAQMNAAFTVNNVTTSQELGKYTSSGWATTGADVSIQTPTLTNGDEYSWSVQAWNQFDYGAVSPTCYIKVDTTPPSNPTFKAATWPTLSSGQPSPTGSGSFTVTATDTISGVDGYFYSFDTEPVPSSGGTFQTGTTSTINYTPTTWGAHTLYVQTLDNAGNLSAVSSYSFYAPWNPASQGVTGSVTGKTVPDFVTNPSTGSQNGDLVDVPGDSNPDTTPTVIGLPTDSPDGKSWANAQISHDGSFAQHIGQDDLWAFENSTNSLYLYLNNLNTETPFEGVTKDSIDKQKIDSDIHQNPYVIALNATTACVSGPTACASYDDTSFPAGTQILAPGDLYAFDPNTTANIGAVDNGAPGLLTVENDALWYYQGQSGPNYLGIAEQLGTSGWSGTTLIGTTTGVTSSGGKQTYLWARINSTGAIMQYPITFDSSGNLVNLDTPASTSNGAVQVTLPDTANAPQNTTSDLLPIPYPQLYAWDMHNTGHPDLIATTPSGTTIDWPGVAPATTGEQLSTPESLTAATSTTSITIGSVGTDYPSGTTWDDGHATLAFNQGQLTVSTDPVGNVPGEVLAQYGSVSPNSYLTVQTDGNLAIYSATGSEVWALNKGAAGDSLVLSGNALTLESSTGATLWTAESSVPVSPSMIGETAYTNASGDLAVSIGAGTVTTPAAIATGTNPSIADLGTNGYLVAFQATNGDLETYSSNGTTTDTTYAMAPGTSPSIAAYAKSGWAIAYQASNTDMETYTSTGTHEATTFGMEADTSPAVAASSSGGYEVAFQVNTTNLYTDAFTSLTVTSGTNNNTALGMTKATNPAITALTTGGYQIAIQANTGSLWITGSAAGGGNQSLGMGAGTSPAITALPNGEWQAAFEDNNATLWTHGDIAGTGNTGIAMATSTSPAIIATGGETFTLAWHATNGDLTTLAYGGKNATDSDHPMTTGTSPSLTP